jgi:hypothetical protein
MKDNRQEEVVVVLDVNADANPSDLAKTGNGSW